jgi:hypothetical protein
LWEAPRIEFIVPKDRNISLEQNLQLPRHVAPIGRGSHHQTGAFFHQLSDAMRVVCRKDTFLVGPAFETPNAWFYGKFVDVYSLHFGADSAGFFGNYLE